MKEVEWDKKDREEFFKNIPRTEKVFCICGKMFEQTLYFDKKGEVTSDEHACSDKCLKILNEER